MSTDPAQARLPSSRIDVSFLIKTMRDTTEALRRALESNGMASLMYSEVDMARRILRGRRIRETLFPPGLFADPAWDMLLDLFVASAEDRRIYVSSLCIASSVPPTTALRWIDNLENAGLVTRQRDPEDGRRVFVYLLPGARDQISAALRAAVLIR